MLSGLKQLAGIKKSFKKASYLIRRVSKGGEAPEKDEGSDISDTESEKGEAAALAQGQDAAGEIRSASSASEHSTDASDMRVRVGDDVRQGFAGGGQVPGQQQGGPGHTLVRVRRGSYTVLGDDAAQEGEGISRQDFARRRFAMSSTAWKLQLERQPDEAIKARSMFAEQGEGGRGGHGETSASTPFATPAQTPSVQFAARRQAARLNTKEMETVRITLALNGSGGLLMCPLDVSDAMPVAICNVSSITQCNLTAVVPPYDDAFSISFTDQLGTLKTCTFAVSSDSVLQEWLNLLKPPKAVKSGTDMFTKVRAMVSGNRRRYQEDGYDLDLSYITKRIIAMAFPGEDTIGPFSIALRNDMKDVRRFFDEKHKGCYKIFNLCAEKVYDPSNFHNNCQHIPFLDHNPPTLRQLKRFVSEAMRWIRQRRTNIIAVHCKGGKGRTGVIVAALLLSEAKADGIPMEPKEAVEIFTKGRTQNEDGPQQGPTCASQLRYVDFFYRALQLQGRVPNRFFKITNIAMMTVPLSEKVANFRPVVRVSCSGREIYCSSPDSSFPAGSMETVVIDLSDKDVVVNEDFKVEMFNGKPKDENDEQRFADRATWFICTHTGMEGDSPLIFDKSQVDGPHKDNHCKRFRAEFSVEIEFEEREAEQHFVIYPEDIQESVFDTLKARGKSIQVRSGETLCQVSDSADNRIFLVAEGSVRCEKVRESGGPAEVVESEPIVCGEGSFLLAGARNLDIVTNQDSLVYSIKPGEVSAIFGDEASKFYHLLAVHLTYKLAAKSAAKQKQIKSSGHLDDVYSKQYSALHSLPHSERIVSSGKCQAVSKISARGPGMLLIMRRYVLFHATAWKGGSSQVICPRDIVKVDGPCAEVGSGGAVILLVRLQGKNGRTFTEEVRFRFTFIHVASEVAQHLREVSRRLHDFRMISPTKSSDLSAHSVLPEIFAMGEFCTVERHDPWKTILQDGSQLSLRLYCILSGHALIKSGGLIIDRLETGDLMGEVSFTERDVYRSKQQGTVIAGRTGAIVVSVSFDHVSAVLEADANLAHRFYEYVSKVMYRRLRDNLYCRIVRT